MKYKKFAIIISGCDYKDGTENTEIVSTLNALSEAKVEYKIFAPSPIESTRTAREQVEDLKNLNTKEFDAVIFPGSQGAALHLCNFAEAGSKCKALPEVKQIIDSFYGDSKPIGAFCIAPALIACVLGKNNITVTIGNDAETARELEKMGAVHVNCAVDDYISDRESKVVTTPAFTGIRRAIREIIEMA